MVKNWFKQHGFLEMMTRKRPHTCRVVPLGEGEYEFEWVFDRYPDEELKNAVHGKSVKTLLHRYWGPDRAADLKLGKVGVIFNDRRRLV